MFIIGATFFIRFKVIKMMKNYDQSIEINNSNWPYIPDHPYRILIIAGSRSGKANVIELDKNQRPNIDKNYLYLKDTFES